MCVVLQPCEILVIPRGIKFSINLQSDSSSSSDGAASSSTSSAPAAASFARGYVLEVYKGHFELPGLGPIGANGLANPRHFLYPTAAFVDSPDTDAGAAGAGFTIVNKYSGELFSCASRHCPFDVVAWYGNYAPYKYDLRLFNTMNTVSFDHPDPSIFTGEGRALLG